MCTITMLRKDVLVKALRIAKEAVLWFDCKTKHGRYQHQTKSGDVSTENKIEKREDKSSGSTDDSGNRHDSNDDSHSGNSGSVALGQVAQAQATSIGYLLCMRLYFFKTFKRRY